MFHFSFLTETCMENSTKYTSSIFKHALLKIVQNLLLQRFNDAVITFIRQEKVITGFLPDEGDHSIIEMLQ